MEIWDLVIVESGGGGDFTVKGNDLATCKSIETAVYLALFGGNIQADTVTPRSTVDLSYWGNSLFHGAKPVTQFNSLTERTLQSVPLTSSGRQIIENAIKKDLSFLPNVTVSVIIVSTDRINVRLKIVLQTGEERIGTFSLIRNGQSGDFDLHDFNFNDFF